MGDALQLYLVHEKALLDGRLYAAMKITAAAAAAMSLIDVASLAQHVAVKPYSKNVVLQVRGSMRLMMPSR